MSRISEKFIRMIHSDAPDTGIFRKSASKASKIYGAAALLKPALYSKGVLRPEKLDCPVISLGNLTVGGTGKTPAAIALARMLSDMGFHPAILSRGYGGSLQKKGGLVSDGKNLLLSATFAGDEPCLMALALPGAAVAVGGDRAKSGRLCVERLDCDVCVLDDGFQHMALHRDINILLADARRPFGNGRTLPRGPLREPASQIKRAGALVLTRALPHSPVPAQWPLGRPVFRAAHRPAGLVEHDFFKAPGPVAETRPMLPVSSLKGKRLAVFSGIAGNEAFFESLSELGGKIAYRRGFADHHPYAEGEIGRIFSEARKSGADLVITTEKDAVRINRVPEGGPPLFALCIDFSFYDPAAFASWLKMSLESLPEKPQ